MPVFQNLPAANLTGFQEGRGGGGQKRLFWASLAEFRWDYQTIQAWIKYCHKVEPTLQFERKKKLLLVHDQHTATVAYFCPSGY